MDEKQNKPKILFYLFLNAGIVNVIWWFFFMFGTHVTAKKSDYFNDIIAPIFDNVYSICVLACVVIITLGIVLCKLNHSLGKSIIFLGMWTTILTPSLQSIYYILLFAHGKADIPNLVVIPMAIGVSFFNFMMGKIFIIKPYQKNI